MKPPAWSGPEGMTRRDVLRLGAGVTAGAAVGPFVMRVAGAQEAFSWQRFKGSKIYVLFHGGKRLIFEGNARQVFKIDPGRLPKETQT